jgi:uncharacterized protein YcbK (DUF882 family)
MNFKKIFLISLIVILSVGIFYRLILKMYGLEVTSWWRSPWKNIEVGGNWLSLHLIGWAFDVVPVNKSLHPAMAWFPFGSWYPESDHVHIQIIGKGSI